MRKLICIFIFSLSLSGVFAQSFKMPADTEFFYLYGGANPDVGRCIKETPDGGYIIAGTSSSFGPGDASVYLVKTDSMGKHLWSGTYGGTQNDWGYSVEVTADSGYFVAGYSNSFNPSNGYDAYYFKTDKNGATQWEKTISGADWDFIYGSTAMADGGFILCGETFTNSNGGTDAYLVRLDANGNTIWAKNYGGLFDETFNSVTIMNNRIYAVGKNATHATDTISDGWIVKLDTNGIVLKDAFVVNTCSPCYHFGEVVLGITPYTNSTLNFCGKVEQRDSNSVMSMLGRIDTSMNLFLVSMDGPVSPGQTEIFSHIINLDNGNFCIVGNALGGLGGQNSYIVGFNPGNGFINGFIRHSGGILDDYGYDGIYTTKGKVVTVGSSQDFCSAGTEDLFLVRFNSDSIQNGPLSGKAPKVVCFADTLPLWEIYTHYYTNDLAIKLFPNPAITVMQLNISSISQKTFKARVFSVLGTEVLTFKAFSGLSNTVDLSQLEGGSYFLRLQNESGQDLSVLKFVVNR